MKGIITVADSKLWLHRDTLTPQVRSLFMEQIRHAHLLLANKTDLLTEAEQGQVVYELQGLNPHAFILQTTNGRVPLSLLEGLKATTQVDKADIVKAPIASMQLGSRLVDFTDREFTQEQFKDWVRALPETIYRMKAMYRLRASKPNAVPICLWNGSVAPRISKNASKTCYYWRECWFFTCYWC